MYTELFSVDEEKGTAIEWPGLSGLWILGRK